MRILKLEIGHVPESQPSTIDFSTKDQPSRFKGRFYVVNLKLSEGIIETNVGSLPVTFTNIYEPIHIVLRCFNIQITPQSSNCLYIIYISAKKPVLVLNLKHDYAFFGILLTPQMLFDDRGHSCKVYPHFFHEILIQSSNLQLMIGQQPRRESSEVPLSTHVRPRPDKYFHLVLFSQFQEESEILIVCLKIKHSPLNFVVIPHDIDTESIQAHGFDHHDAMLPVLDRNSGVVDLTRVDFGVLLSIEATGVDVWLEGLIPAAVMQVGRQAGDEDEEHRRHGCVLAHRSRKSVLSICRQFNIAWFFGFVHFSLLQQQSNQIFKNLGQCLHFLTRSSG